jgi:tRNA(Ile)-lysidine synthase
MNLVLPKPGTYVLAVSGGVDSMVLLDLLCQEPELRLVVAHYDHGMRPDSLEDRRLVQAIAAHHEVPFVYQEGHLGAGTSEAAARKARYQFLKETRQASGAGAIITAHHQDDVLETAIINLLRGTGRKGLTALSSRHDVVRPLLHVSKQELLDYARTYHLEWREDTTNQNPAYLRNYVRQNLLSRFTEADRAQLYELVEQARPINHELDSLIMTQLHLQSTAGRLDRTWFNHLPHAVALEVLAGWLRAHDIRGFDRKGLERLVVAAKTAVAGRSFPVVSSAHLLVHQHTLALQGPER